MEIGNKINQLRKLSGMTQEQLAEKLNVSRQTISKWESDSTSPDLESIVKISRIFHVSLDDLLKEGEAGVANKTDEQITLEDLMKINLHNRKMTLLLISGLIFIMVSILNFAYVIALQSTTLSTQYMLYRYIVTGQYENAPIDYMRLMIPSIIAAAIGVILFISYTIERRKKETENMYKAKKFISYMALCVLIFSLCACGEKGSENAAIYGETVGGLEDNELFAIIDTNSSLPVLLVTSQVYNDGLGNQAALNCDVYYLIDKEVKNIGTIESMGTAYPIAYDETGIYAASGHDMQRFEIEKSGSLRLAEGIYEQFDESGNAAYTMKKGEETDVITEEEYYAAFEKYSNATIVNFSYGASDAGKAEVVTNNELEPRQGNIAEDVNVLEIVQETASEFAVKKMETSYF